MLADVLSRTSGKIPAELANVVAQLHNRGQERKYELQEASLVITRFAKLCIILDSCLTNKIYPTKMTFHTSLKTWTTQKNSCPSLKCSAKVRGCKM